MTTYPIYDLGDARFSLKHPIPVLIFREEDEWVAEQPEINACECGALPNSAIQDLKKPIVYLLETIVLDKSVKLGKRAAMHKRWLQTMVTVVKKGAK